MKHQVVNVTEFKAKCLALLDEIGERGGTITITRRGKPLARVGPVPQTGWTSPEGSWIGKVDIPDDVLDADTADLWDVARLGISKRRKGKAN
jgi:prevent-host-death family protein